MRKELTFRLLVFFAVTSLVVFLINPSVVCGLLVLCSSGFLGYCLEELCGSSRSLLWRHLDRLKVGMSNLRSFACQIWTSGGLLSLAFAALGASWGFGQPTGCGIDFSGFLLALKLSSLFLCICTIPASVELLNSMAVVRIGEDS